MNRMYGLAARLSAGLGLAMLMASLVVVPESQLKADPPVAVPAPVNCTTTCTGGTVAKNCQDPGGSCTKVAGTNAKCTACGKLSVYDGATLISCGTSCGEILP